MVQKSTIEEIIRLRTEGLSYQKIADKLKLSKPTVIKYLVDYKNLILNCNQIRNEAFAQELKNSHRVRLMRTDELYSKVMAEIEKRDLSQERFSELNKILQHLDGKLAEAEEFAISSEMDIRTFGSPLF